MRYLVDFWQISIAKGCHLAGLSRRSWYRPDPAETKLAKDAPVIDALNKIIEKHARWGFWKFFIDSVTWGMLGTLNAYGVCMWKWG